MKPIAKPVDLKLLKAELNPDRFVRKTNNMGNDIFIVSASDAPNVMTEIGRLRELTFRHAGGGTGKDLDIDAYDTDSENPYLQLIVWDPEKQAILGGYRYIDCAHPSHYEDGSLKLATRGLFEFSQKFIDDYLPYTIELGRSFVCPEYQSTRAGRKALFALDNLWDGLGALVIDHPHMKYFFGKVTMYTSYNREARDILLYFMKKIFPDTDKLVFPVKPLGYETDIVERQEMFTYDNYKDNYKQLSKLIRSYGINIPPLINTYMNLSPSMKTFGTALNTHFGDVEETGILINTADIYDVKKQRHIDTYKPE